MPHLAARALTAPLRPLMLAVVLGASAASAVQGATITQSASGGALAEDPRAPDPYYIGFRRFDPRLGTLTGVEAALRLTFEGEMFAYSMTDGTVEAGGFVLADVALLGSGLGTIASLAADNVGPREVASFSSLREELTLGDRAERSFATPEALSFFTAAPGQRFFLAAVSIIGGVQSDDSSVTGRLDGSASVEVDLTYDYTPAAQVPLPAAGLLLLGALAPLAAARRR